MLPYAVVVVVVAFARASRVRWPDDVVPGTPVLEEGSGLTDVAADGNRTVATVTGGLDDALTTMNFHREQISDYLCRQYMVEGILQEMSKGASSPSPESRSIVSADGRETGNTLLMKTDQGSSAYNAWLTKTKLLKRIYDEYDLDVKMYEKPVGFAPSNKNNDSSTAPYDHDTVKNSQNVAKNPKRSKQHSDALSGPKETVSVDVAQSHSIQYDLDDGADDGHSRPPPPNLPSHYGPPGPRPTQTPQQQHPSSSYGPPSPLSSYESHSLRPDTSYDEFHSYPDTYVKPPPYSHSSYEPPSHSPHHESPHSSHHESPHSSHHESPHSSHHESPHSSYHESPHSSHHESPHSSHHESPHSSHHESSHSSHRPSHSSHSSHRPSHSSHHESSHSSYGPPHLYEYESPHLLYDYHLMPPTDYGPPSTIESGPDHSPGDEETPDGPDEETDNSDDDTVKQGLTATDLYDLTLTAVAFLGFGTFVMNLFMDAMAIQSGATLVMNPSPLLGVGVSRNDKHNSVHPVVSEIDELAWIAVSAIDNMMANVDETPVDCDEVKRLCRRSKRLVKTGANFSSKLLPVWNISLGWLSKKLGKDTGQPVISALLGHCTLPSQCQ